MQGTYNTKFCWNVCENGKIMLFQPRQTPFLGRTGCKWTVHGSLRRTSGAKTLQTDAVLKKYCKLQPKPNTTTNLSYYAIRGSTKVKNTKDKYTIKTYENIELQNRQQESNIHQKNRKMSNELKVAVQAIKEELSQKHGVGKLHQAP